MTASDIKKCPLCMSLHKSDLGFYSCGNILCSFYTLSVPLTLWNSISQSFDICRVLCDAVNVRDSLFYRDKSYVNPDYHIEITVSAGEALLARDVLSITKKP